MVNYSNSWTKLTWSMELSFEKCKIVMDLRNQNNKKGYLIADRKLSKTACERGLWALVSLDGKWHEQVCSTESKANRVLGIMKSTFSCWSDDIARKIYPTFIMQDLEFASLIWNPHLK